MLPFVLIVLFAATASCMAPLAWRPDIQKVAILGERHSGTNYVEDLLDVNFYVHLDSKPTRGRWSYVAQKVPGMRLWSKHCYSFPFWQRPAGVWGRDWEQKMPEDLAALNLAPGEWPTSPLSGFDDMLAVVVVRNPYDWAMAMYKYCWCEFSDVHKLHSKDVSFEEFFNTPIKDACVRPGTGGSPNRSAGTCKGFLECRGEIYRSHLAMGYWAPNVEYVRHEDLSTDALVVKWLEKLEAKYRFRARTSLHNIHTYTAPKNAGSFWNVSKEEREKHDMEEAKARSLFWNPGQLATNQTLRHWVTVINTHLDKEVESKMGYRILEP